MSKSPVKPSRALAAQICRALIEKKAEDLKVLDVSAQSSITDYLVLATGNSETHLRALRIELDRVLKDTGTRVVGRDEVRESGWSVVDAFDVMVHLFLAEKREFFALDHLWRDAEEETLESLSGEPKKKAVKAAPSGRRVKKRDGGVASTGKAKPRKPRQKP